MSPWYIHWCTVIVSIKFLLDFLVLDNLDRTLLKLCKLILPSVHFSGCTMVWFYELHLRKKKSTAICCAINANELYTGILNSRYLLSGTCRQKLIEERHWLKCFLSRFSCITVSFISTTDKFVANVSELDTHHRYINIVWNWINKEWIYKKCKTCFWLRKRSNLVWNSSSSLTIYTIASSRKTFLLIKEPNFRFRFAVVVIKSSSLPGDQCSV